MYLEGYDTSMLICAKIQEGYDTSMIICAKRQVLRVPMSFKREPMSSSNFRVMTCKFQCSSAIRYR